MQQEQTISPPAIKPFFRGCRELAEYLSVSERTIRRAMRKHQLPYTRLGGAILFRRTEVEVALEAMTVPSIHTLNKRPGRSRMN